MITVAASKQENATVVNANKRDTGAPAVHALVYRILARWSDVLRLVQRFMMAEPIEVIDVSPVPLHFGNAIQLDRGIFLPQLPMRDVEAEIALSEWADRSHGCCSTDAIEYCSKASTGEG